jgi:hypothetical protein
VIRGARDHPAVGIGLLGSRIGAGAQQWGGRCDAASVRHQSTVIAGGDGAPS